MGMENPLLLMGGDFGFYCLQLKKPVVISKTSKSRDHIYFCFGGYFNLTDFTKTIMLASTLDLCSSGRNWI